MSNRELTNQEILKIIQLYEGYGAKKLPEFLQMIWQEAYDLGHSDGRWQGYNESNPQEE